MTLPGDAVVITDDLNTIKGSSLAIEGAKHHFLSNLSIILLPTSTFHTKKTDGDQN